MKGIGSFWLWLFLVKRIDASNFQIVTLTQSPSSIRQFLFYNNDGISIDGS